MVVRCPRRGPRRRQRSTTRSSPLARSHGALRLRWMPMRTSCAWLCLLWLWLLWLRLLWLWLCCCGYFAAVVLLRGCVGCRRVPVACVGVHSRCHRLPRPGTMADLKHQVAKPKLSLLKKKLKSRRSLRRMQSGSNVTAPAPPADRHLPAADDRGYGDYDPAGGASSYGQPASRQTYQDRGGYGQRRSNPTPSPEPPAAPTRHPPRAGSSSSSSSHRGRRGSRGSPQQRQQDLHRHDPYDDGASRRGGLRHSPPPAGAPVARRRAAAPAVPGGRVVATECTRQQGCQCAACAAADAAVDMPAPIPAEVEIERVACPDCGRKFSREALSRHAVRGLCVCVCAAVCGCVCVRLCVCGCGCVAGRECVCVNGGQPWHLTSGCLVGCAGRV